MMFHDPYALSTTLGRCYRQTLQQADFILAVLPFAFSKNLLHLWFPSNFFLIVPLFFIQTWFSIHPPISTLGSVHLHSFFTIFFIVTHLSAMSIMFFFQKRAARCQSISPGLLFRGGCPKFQTAPRSLLVLHFCVISAIAAIANGFPLHGFVPDVCDPKCHSFTMFYAQCCGEWIARNSHPPGCIFFCRDETLLIAVAVLCDEFGQGQRLVAIKFPNHPSLWYVYTSWKTEWCSATTSL